MTKLFALLALWLTLLFGASFALQARGAEKQENVVAVMVDDAGAMLMLASDHGDCGKNARVARLQTKDAEFTGCWILREGVVFILWDDGDRGAVPASVFKWALGRDA